MPKKNRSISALETYKDPSMMDKKIHSLESKILPKKSGLIEISIDDVLDRLSGNKTVNSPAVGGNWHASSSSGSNRCPTYPIHQPSPKNTTPRVMFSPSIHQPPSVRSPSHTLSSTSYPDKNYPDRDTQLTPHIDELDASRTLQTRLHTLASIGRQIEWLTARHREEEETLSLAVRQYLAVNQMKKTEIEGTTVELQAEVHRLGEEKQRMAVMWDTFRTEGEAVIRRMNETIKVLRDQIVEERTSRENAEISFQRQLAEAREMFLLFHEQTVQKINGYENYISSYEATLSEYTSLLEETRKITAILQDENEELKMLCKISENDANQTETIKGLLTELRKEKTERLRIEEQTSILVEAQQRTIDSLEERLRVMQHTPPPNSGKLRGTTPRTNRTERVVVDSCFTTPLPADRTPNAPNNTLINILEGSESSADQQIKKNHVHDVFLEKAADSKSEESDPSCETLGHSVSDECFRIFVNDFVNSILEKVCREIQLSGMKRAHKKFSTAVEELEILQHQYKEELPSSTVKQDVVLEVSRQQHPSDGIEQQHQANSAVDSSTFIQGRINEILNAKKIGYRSGQGSNGTVASTFPSSEENLESSGPRAPMGVASLIQDLHQAQVSEEKIRAETNQQATFFDDETLLESITTELDSVVQDVLFQAHEAYNL